MECPHTANYQIIPYISSVNYNNTLVILINIKPKEKQTQMKEALQMHERSTVSNLIWYLTCQPIPLQVSARFKRKKT